VGADTADDAGVYLIDGETALILTVDFFTPIADDAYQFGQVAAANALSDVYAMGGRPIAALNVCCFPDGEDKAVLREILKGGADKVAEAGAVIAGGHSVRDQDMKYGLAVVGLVHPDRVMTNAGARPGDKLVLTKPVGTGLLATARRKDAISEDEFRPALDNMLELNRAAAEAMVEVGANACTDVTGFGLIGHALEMAEASGAALAIDFASVPLLPLAMKCAEDGHVPGGTGKNREHFACKMEGAPSEAESAALFDPQTSGGLLISAAPEQAGRIADRLGAAIIGEVLAKPAGKVIVGS